MSKIFSILLIVFLLSFAPYPIFASSNVFINEIMTDPPSGQNEWVELFFPNVPIDVSAYKLKDKSGKEKLLANVQNCDKYVVYELPTGDGWLNNSDGESLYLYDANANLVDSKENFQYVGEGKTLGRISDGSDNWLETESPTKCAANSAAYQDPPSPIPASSPSPSPSASTQTTASSPGTSPAKSPSPKAQVKPSGTNTSAKQAVLGSSTQSPQEIALDINDPNNSPSPTLAPAPGPTSKVAGFVLAAGALTIALSLGLFLWYKWEIKGSPKEPQD